MRGVREQGEAARDQRAGQLDHEVGGDHERREDERPAWLRAARGGGAVGGDAVGSAGAVIAGLLVLAYGWHAADPIISVFIGLLLVVAAVRVLREATHVLLEGTPVHVDLMALRDAIEGMADVEGCHDLHTWTIASGYHALSAHVTIGDDCAGVRVRELQGRLRTMASEKYGIAHVTIQLERGDGACVEEVHVPGPAAGAPSG